MEFRVALVVVLGLSAALATEARSQQKQAELQNQPDRFEEELQREGDKARLTLAKFSTDLQVAERRVRMTLANITAAKADVVVWKMYLRVLDDRVELYQKLQKLKVKGKAVITKEELVNLELARDKYFQEVIEKHEAFNLCVHEFHIAQLDHYRLVTLLRKLAEKE